MMAYYNKCQILVDVRLRILFSEQIDFTSMNVKEKRENYNLFF